MQQDYLYRFRSAKALLDEYHELERQQIYFCPPDGLNDPLEGFKNIFWQGDHIVWRNLLRHYLFVMMQAASLAAVAGQSFTQDMCVPLIHQTEHNLPDAPIRGMYQAICARFFSHAVPERLIAHLSSRSRKVKRDEVRFYLRVLHPLATRSVLSVFAERHLMQPRSTQELDAQIDAMSGHLSVLLQAYEQPDDVSEVIFSIAESQMAQIALIHDLNNPAPQESQSWFFLCRDFPDYYVKALERLLYPDHHIACFVEDPTNSAMWGVYGDSHRGACLKFKIGVSLRGRSTLDLYRVNSWSGGKSGVSANYAYVPHSFEQVRYTSEFPEVDFFESMGTLPRSQLTQFWFAGPNGERSATAERMLREDETWRRDYWNKFAVSLSMKSNEWAHERESRLVLHSNLQKFDDKASRTLTYRFSDLAGIIFGMNMTPGDKRDIIRIVEQKCDSEGRKDFEFHQAHYSERSKKIELTPQSLLKFR